MLRLQWRSLPQKLGCIGALPGAKAATLLVLAHAKLKAAINGAGACTRDTGPSAARPRDEDATQYMTQKVNDIKHGELSLT